MQAAAVVREIAAAQGREAGQIALAWLLHKGDDIVPIPGTKRRSYLEENVAAETVRSIPPRLSARRRSDTGKNLGAVLRRWIMATIDR